MRRIDGNYAVAQGFYWASNCMIKGFAVIYLASKGISDKGCGMPIALGYMIFIVLQLCIADYLDKHISIPIKYAIMFVLCVTLGGAILMRQLNMMSTILILVYGISYAANLCNQSFLNAQMVQFNNAGIAAHYGWTRGIGSVVYAVASFMFGIWVE